MARETGVSWVGVRRSNHAGPAGLYAEMPAAAGMIGMYAAVANANHMAVWGGADPLLGTNPLAFGVPAGGGPLVLDMATTVVSYGTVKNYALQGKPMQPGWMVNTATGEDIIDAKRAAEGLLLPIGGYKGSGLAVMLGLIGGPLNRAAFGRDVVDFNADDASETNTGHFIVALDVARFLPLDAYKAEVDRHVARAEGVASGCRASMRSACRASGGANAARSALRDGVPLAPPLVAQLDKMAGELGVKPLGATLLTPLVPAKAGHSSAEPRTGYPLSRASSVSTPATPPAAAAPAASSSPTDRAPWSASGSCALPRPSRPASAGRAPRG